MGAGPDIQLFICHAYYSHVQKLKTRPHRKTQGLRDAIELIQRTAQQAAGAQTVPVETHGRLAYVRLGDAIHKFPTEAAPRRHLVDSLEDLIAYVQAWRNDQPENRIIVWHSHHGGVVAVLDDEGDRLDMVTLELAESDEFKTLRILTDTGRVHDQRAFVRLLRVTLAGCLRAPELIGNFRAIDWDKSEKGHATAKHGQESLGKVIQAKVQGVNGLPEELLLDVPVYANRGERARFLVRCAVEIDVHSQSFQLVPFPGELDKMIEAAQDGIGERLGKALPDVGIFAGRP